MSIEPPIGAGETQMRSGRVWMWLGGAATVIGLVVIALSLGNDGELSGRTVLYTVVALLAWGRGFFTYREGLAPARVGCAGG